MRTGGAFRTAFLALTIAAAAAPVVGQEAEPGMTSGAPLELRSSEADPVAAAPASPNPLAGLALERLSATRELPLFTPSRAAPVEAIAPEVVDIAAPEPEPEAPPETAPEPPALKLIGVVMTGSEQVAILSDEGTGEIRRLRPGEAYEGWELQIVDTRTVAFQNGDQRHEFKMFQPGSNPAPDPGARTPVPEEALQNPGALMGGAASEFDAGQTGVDPGAAPQDVPDPSGRDPGQNAGPRSVRQRPGPRGAGSADGSAEGAGGGVESGASEPGEELESGVLPEAGATEF